MIIMSIWLVLEYSPTFTPKLGPNVGKYSSTMEKNYGIIVGIN